MLIGDVTFNSRKQKSSTLWRMIASKLRLEASFRYSSEIGSQEANQG